MGPLDTFFRIYILLIHGVSALLERGLNFFVIVELSRLSVLALDYISESELLDRVGLYSR